MMGTSSALAPTSSERLASPSEAAAIVSTRTMKRQSVRMQCRLLNRRAPTLLLGGLVFLLVLGQISLQTAAFDEQTAAAAQSKSQAPSGEPAAVRSTQPTVDRQMDSPNLAALSVSQPTTQAKQAEAQQVSAAASNSITAKTAETGIGGKPTKPKQSAAASSSQKKAALASQQNYDKYQLKAHNTTPLGSPSQSAAAAASSSSLAAAAAGESSSKDSTLSAKVSKDEPSSAASSASGSSSSGGSQGSSSGSHVAHKKSGAQQAHGIRAKSSFSLLRRFLPSFMTSAAAAGPVVAAAAAASVASDKHQMSHSRSSQSLLTGPDGPLSKASGKIINLLSSKKTAGYGLVPDHAPFFTRKPSIDRQIGGFGASSLLSNPLSLGLLFSAPLIPSLLLTPLAIAGLSPAMSAINNFFGDDEEASSNSASTPGSSPLSVLTGPSSPLSSILQGSGAASALSSAASSSGTPSFALQAVQSFLGPPATTEKPLFNPGLFASQGIQNAMGSLSSSSSSSGSSGSSSSSSGGLSQPSNSPIRNLLSGNLIQTAASMISPSFAAPPGSSSSGSGASGGSSGSNAAGSSESSDDGPGFMQVASDVFDKVANYMSPEKEVAQASSSSSVSSPVSPLSSLVGLSNFSPFQLSSLLASSPLAAAFAPPPLTSSHSGSSSHGSSSTAPTTQRAGFFSTLKNIYELFSSSFLRRQEVGDSNECQQRLICELHQRAMNSKLFRRSLQANLMELANLDKSIQEQIKNNPMQARVDTETKAMLSDFLKATNNFKNGRELASCSQMFPKCSRTMLLSTANAHLTDPANSKAIGKFSNLMKKMKFKSIQQHQSQWKLRKPNKPNTVQLPRSVPNQFQPIDYLQVAPLSPNPSVAGAKPQPGQLTPADSLKLVQQILLMQNQQQQQMQSQYGAGQQQQQIGGPIQFGGNLQQQQPANQVFNLPQPMISSSYPNYAQFPQTNQQQISTIYTDSIPPVYSATESPFYIPQSQPDMSQASSLQQPQQMMQQQQPQLNNQQQQVNTQQQQQAQSNYQYQPASPSSTISDHMVGISSQQVDSNKKVQQQSASISSKVASAA